LVGSHPDPIGLVSIPLALKRTYLEDLIADGKTNNSQGSRMAEVARYHCHRSVHWICCRQIARRYIAQGQENHVRLSYHLNLFCCRILSSNNWSYPKPQSTRVIYTYTTKRMPRPAPPNHTQCLGTSQIMTVYSVDSKSMAKLSRHIPSSPLACVQRTTARQIFVPRAELKDRCESIFIRSSTPSFFGTPEQATPAQSHQFLRAQVPYHAACSMS
jgi:hypothetical protein